MLQFEWKEVTWGLVKMWIPEQPQVPMKQVCGKEVLVDSGTAGLNLSRRNSRKRPAGCPHGLPSGIRAVPRSSSGSRMGRVAVTPPWVRGEPGR